MKHQYLTNEALEDAQKNYLVTLIQQGMCAKIEKIAVQDALGRVTSCAVYAQNSSPHYNASAMDGIALMASSTFGASQTTPVCLVENDHFVVVDTGDRLPRNYDCVVMIEDVVQAEGHIKLFSSAAPWQHIRQIGEDICHGDMLLPSFVEITPFSMGAMLAGGVGEVDVIARPIVGIIPTGDEIVLPCAHPKEGDIVDFNSTIFGAMLTQWGAVPKAYPIVKDVLSQIVDALQTAVDECDAVLLIAGSSAGREDYSATAIATVGTVFLHGIAIKPGKPAILGYAQAKPILGLPGYPGSGIVVMEQLFYNIVTQLTHKPKIELITQNATLTRQLTSSLKYREFIRTRVGKVGGQYVVTPLNRGAGIVTSLVQADAVLEIDQNAEGLEQASTVCVQLLKSRKEIEHAVVVIGSHDPLLDELNDLMQRSGSGFCLSSSHVGSMGGIMAMKRKEAHMGGIHLLDEFGEYNHRYVKKFFPNGGVARICGIGRTQGLIVKKGNPMGLHNLADIAAKGARYVNRQKGSGTRILCDYLLKQQYVDSSELNGYQREEYTHTAVGAIVQSNSADVGLGIYCAAKLYDLQFIPLCEEQYDLLVTQDALQQEGVLQIIELLKSDAFLQRLTHLGGYTVGKIEIVY